jgi:ABC-2 type transport system ATP-binding protein
MIELTSRAVDREAAPLVVEGLVKRYPGASVNAVDGVTFALGRGEIFGLLGPNGAGKTTTVSAATTRTRPTAGRASIAGVDVVQRPSVVRRRLGVVTQINTLDRSLSVGENLYYHCRYFGLSRREARLRSVELLERFGLEQRGGEQVERLSGGLAQRVQLARALAHRPAVLFLDEPTAGLDPQSRLALWDTVRELREQDAVSVLLTTHYMEEADQLCDRVAIIDHGQILVCDEPAALKRRGAGSARIELRLKRPPEPSLIERLRALPGVRAANGRQDGIEVVASARDGLLPTLVSTASDSLRDLSVSEPSLESVFIELTGRTLRD